MSSPSLFRLILSHETKILRRNRVLVALFAVLLLLLLSTLWAGHRRLQRQQRTLAAIGRHEQRTAAELKRRIALTEAHGGTYPGYIWDDPVFPYNAASKLGARFATKQPFALQLLNVGQGDIQPYYYLTTTQATQKLTHGSEIENSFLQFIGHFDFSFVVIYLLPLLIVVFTYNVLSAEKEQGTWVLLKTSNQSVARLVALRTGIRYLLFSGLFWAVVAPALLAAIGPGFLATANWWWLVAAVSLYFAFWFALALFVNGFGRSSTLNALALIFAWLLIVMLVPNLLQIGLSQAYPIPSRISLVNEERDVVNKFYKKQGTLLTKRLLDNPLEMIRTVQVVTPELVYGYGVVAYTRQEITDRAAEVTKARLEAQLSRQQAGIQRLMYLSPALLLQEQLSALTGTHFHQFREFTYDVEAYKKQLQAFFIPKILDKATYHTFSAADADRIPRYQPRQYAGYRWLNLPLGVLVVGLAVAALLGAGYRLLRYSTR